MAERLAERVLRKISEARHLYHRLSLVVGAAGSGKTSALQEVSRSTSARLVNVNLEVSRRMLDLTQRQRVLQIGRILGEIVAGVAGELVLLDNVEILFDVGLRQDALRLLQGLSRNKTVVASWNGEMRSETRGVAGDRTTDVEAAISEHRSTVYLTYAVPGHPEYRRYPVEGFRGGPGKLDHDISSIVV